MTWLKTDYYFSIHMATLTVDRRNAREYGLETAVAECSPASIEAVFFVMLNAMRPDLLGGQLEAMSYSLESAQWLFAYSHPSLPIRHEGCWAERIRMEPEVMPVIVHRGDSE